jgi:ribosomal protein S25
MGRQTKLTASQHEEIRAAFRERQLLLDRAKADRQRARRITMKGLARRYGVNPRTIGRVMSGEPYGSVKPEPDAIS